MGKVKIKMVVEKDPNGERVEPILINFQHTELSKEAGNMDLNSLFTSAVFQTNPATSSRKDYSHLSRPGFDGSRRNSGSGKSTLSCKTRQLVALQSDTMTYIGSSEESDDKLRTYVAMRSGKRMRIYEVTPITVAPFIKGHSYVVEKEKDTEVKKSREEKTKATVDLVKAFGSKRKRLNYEKIEKNKIDVADMNESMSKAQEEIKGPDEEIIIKDESMLTLIPPCNREATDVRKVYLLEDLLGDDELEILDEVAEKFFNITEDQIKEWEAAKKYSDYFFSMWKKLRARKGDPIYFKTAKLVLYTELLICILKLRHDQVRKKAIEIPDVFPSWLQEKALDLFTTTNAKGVRNRSEACKDKTCCYIMVLVLLANDFLFDVQLMSTSLNVHIKKMLVLAKAVGITLTTNSSTKEQRGVLKLPLPKPIERRGKRRAFR